jgi:hypothetical protein
LDPCLERSEFCRGFIAGVVDLQRMQQAIDPDDMFRFCEPEGVSLDQFRRVVVKHFEDNPELLHVNGANHVVAALHRAFPCPD